ncbi:MAG: DNA-binding transcriptional regulator [Pirellulales bacterium]|nr:DNA-binding transcriptional regulator [Pirellulales bacterium]
MALKRSRQHHHRLKVALIVETSLASGRDVLRGIGDYVRQQGPWSIYHEPRGLEDPVPKWLQGWGGDGIIARVQNKNIATAVQVTGLPVVDVLGLVPESNLPLVHVDDAAIARLAAEHLLERGFRYFGFCAVTGAHWSNRRRDHFQQVVQDAGYACNVCHLPPNIRGRRTWEKLENQLTKWVAELPKPVGLMACNDPRGQLLLEACRRGEVSVPEEAAVIGVDNDEPLCMISDPPLSSVIPNHNRVGFEAAALLDRLMSGGKRPETTVYVPPLRIATRMSTDVSAIDDAEMAPIVRFVRERACDGINVHDVVQFSGLSRSTLLRKTQKILGRTLHAEIVRVRLRRASELLTETDLSIESITEKSGFSHRQYLGKVFKAEFGETLAEFRKRFRR